MTPWHASSLHACLTALRDFAHERVEAVVDIVTAREIVDTSVRVDLMLLHVSRLTKATCGMSGNLDRTLEHVERLVLLVELMGRRIDQNDAGGRQMEDDIALLANRIKALEAAVDTEARYAYCAALEPK